MHVEFLWLCLSLCKSVDCGLPGFSVGGFSRQEYWIILANTSCHILLVVYPSYPSTIFPAALASNDPEYLVLPGHLRPKQLHHLPTWPSRRQTQVLQGRSKPQWMTYMQRWK